MIIIVKLVKTGAYVGPEIVDKALAENKETLEAIEPKGFANAYQTAPDICVRLNSWGNIDFKLPALERLQRNIAKVMGIAPEELEVRLANSEERSGRLKSAQQNQVRVEMRL